MTTEHKKYSRKGNTYGGLLTTGIAAAMCKVAPRTVSKWFDAGLIPGYRIPGSNDRRIRKEDLVVFMRKHGMEVPRELVDEPRLIGFGVNDFDRNLYTNPVLTNFQNLFNLGFELGENPRVSIAILGTAHGMSVLASVFDRIKSVCPDAQMITVLEPGDSLPDIKKLENVLFAPVDWGHIVPQLILNYQSPVKPLPTYKNILDQTHDIREQAEASTMQ